MKIEKVNENQIRCTLTREDLVERQIKLSELAYGTDKAKLLFRDMMQQAAYELGFEAEDIPLMIEAIPLSPDTIILLITKVEYPEELDTRFSKFSEPDSEDLYEEFLNGDGRMAAEGADDILGMFRGIKEERQRKAEEAADKAFVPLHGGKEEPFDAPVDITKLFVFNSLAEVERVAGILKDFYTGENHLYKNRENRYYLLISKSSQSPEAFNKVCNMLSEYASQKMCTPGTAAFFKEHCRAVVEGNALQMLAQI